MPDKEVVMKFALGFLQDEQQINIRTYNTSYPEEIVTNIIDAQDLNDENLNLLFVSSEISDELKKLLPCPIIRSSEINISEQEFSNLHFESARQIFEKIFSNWLLANNLSSIQTIFKTSSDLKGMWKQNPNSFFQELWKLLKNNIGTYELRIIYNDVLIREEDGRKDKLIQSYVHGTSRPEIFEGGSAEKDLLQEYTDNFYLPFEIVEFSAAKNELVARASIDKSPILIMAKPYDFNGLQECFLHALFDGLQ